MRLSLWRGCSPSSRQVPFLPAFAVLVLMNTAFASPVEQKKQDGTLFVVQPITEALPFFDNRRIHPDSDAPEGSPPNAAVTTSLPLPCPRPINALPTRSVFPAEDRTVDAVVWFDAEKYPPGSYRLRVTLCPVDGGGAVVAEGVSDKLRHPKNFVSIGVPERFFGKDVILKVALLDEASRESGDATFPLKIAASQPVPSKATIPLRFSPEHNVAPGSPCRVGLPLPRGLFFPGEKSLRLTDSEGKEVAADFQITGRWAPYGSVKWVLVNFLIPLESVRGDFRVEVLPTRDSPDGSDATITKGSRMTAKELAEFARSQGSKLGDRSGASLVTEAFLRGGFVEHASGANYRGWRHETLLTGGRKFVVPDDATWIVESSGETAMTASCADWFVEPDTGARFCKFTARVTIYPQSPFLDFQYTWIFTGDGNRDRIRSMGWNFFAEGFQPEGFLVEERDTPVAGEYLLQFDSTSFEIKDNDRKVLHTGTRSLGLAAGKIGTSHVMMGVRDFWENFPSEMGLSREGFTFFLWPKHGAPRTHGTTAKNAYRLWFAHEGEVLSFALPMELMEGPLYTALSGVEPPFAHGVPESVNAQGIAKSTEIRFHVSGGEDRERIRKWFDGWNARSSDPFVDPKWIAQTGVFPDFYPADPEKFPSFEDDYRLGALWPARLQEALQVYGKWIYGDIPMVGNIDEGTVGLFRAYDKAHWGWPYSWMPYARSGVPQYRKLADAGTRMMTDTAYCHYVSQEVEAQFAALPPRAQWAFYQPFRARGWNNEGLIPWAGGYWGATSRMYCDRIDHIFDQWHLTGYAPGLAVAWDWMALTKLEEPDRFGRGPILSVKNRTRWTDNLLRQYLVAYEETFDPWFIFGAHAIAEMHLWMEKHDGWNGHPWQGGITDFLRYTRNPEYSAFYLRYARHWLEPALMQTVWGDVAPLIQPGVEAWRLSGDEWFLQRARFYADALHMMIRTDLEPVDYQGWLATGGSNEAGLFYGWYLRWAPLLLSALAPLPDPPASIPNGFFLDIAASREGGPPVEIPEIRLRLPDALAEGDDFVTFNLVGLPENAEGVSAKVERVGAGAVADAPLRGGITHVALPLAKPGAEYRVRIMISGSSAPFQWRLPISGAAVREVCRLVSDGVLPSSSGYGEFWFRPPDRQGEDDFVKIGLRANPTKPVRRISLWSENGALLADHQMLNRNLNRSDSIMFRLPKDGGNLVRLTLPGWNWRAEVPVLPIPWYATSSAKWFEPSPWPAPSHRHMPK